MAKETTLRLDGVVSEVLPNAVFRVTLPDGKIVLGHTCGKMRQHKIKILLGDAVTLEMSAYDMTKGRIVFRFK